MISNQLAKQVVDDIKLYVKPVNTGGEHYRNVASLTRLPCGDQALAPWNGSYNLGLLLGGHAVNTWNRAFDFGLLLGGHAFGTWNGAFDFGLLF